MYMIGGLRYVTNAMEEEDGKGYSLIAGQSTDVHLEV
jgi:hypothetical protein